MRAQPRHNNRAFHQANLTIVPTAGEEAYEEYRVGKYISSNETYRYWHRNVDADTRAYFDKYSSVFGWVKRVYGASKLTLPACAILSINETSTRILVRDPLISVSKWY